MQKKKKKKAKRGSIYWRVSELGKSSQRYSRKVLVHDHFIVDLIMYLVAKVND